ncbi:hypothetical protein [Nocardiopsis sp. JB363]|uniref:hypothetical protein n=1 Tax=Nocardiopsis sp. JB363 TaxID=1434837 RepID=UPI00097ABB7B|nr:hypothetical protein [Nocardiopsis sp. JB363]SIO85573.1 hypothetical protein BQ8420_07635 [Nocardiopsis sp. JB363]
MNDECSHDPEDEEDEVGGGVFIGGSMTGGAIVTGKEGRAEDRSRRSGPPSAQELAPPTVFPASLPPNVVGVGGHVTGGALVTGAGGTAVDASTRLDSRSGELLAELARIRRELAGLRSTFEVRAVMEELETVAREIHEKGRAGRGLIERLLGLFNGGSTVLRNVARGAEFADRLRDSLLLLDANPDENGAESK